MNSYRGISRLSANIWCTQFVCIVHSSVGDSSRFPWRRKLHVYIRKIIFSFYFTRIISARGALREKRSEWLNMSAHHQRRRHTHANAHGKRQEEKEKKKKKKKKKLKIEKETEKKMIKTKKEQKRNRKKRNDEKKEKEIKIYFIYLYTSAHGIWACLVYLSPHPIILDHVLIIFTQPLRSGRIWHKVNFLSGV